MPAPRLLQRRGHRRSHRRPLRLALASTALLAVACASRPSTAPPPDLTLVGTPRVDLQSSGTSSLLQAVSVVDSSVVWISGHAGTFVRTVDGGRTWTPGRVPAADTLQFRDVHAMDARTAWLLAAGPADMSRIYRTDDAGATWTLQWTNPEPDGFYDCLDFWDAARGVVYGDAVDGGLRVLHTDDGGRTWRRVPADRLPPALEGEGGFAASGTCVATRPGGLGWIAAGNAPRARAFLTRDYGHSWTAVDVPIVAGEASGLTSISMVDSRHGTAFGGALGVAGRRTDNVARTEDGGRTWTAMPHVSFDGALYGGIHVPRAGRAALLAVGPGGLAASLDGGDTWSTIDSRAWWGIGSAGPGATWIAGPQGRIARVAWPSTAD